MAGTKAGGQKAAATNLERHGKDFYREIGAKGGRISKRKAGGKTRSDKGGHHNMNRKEH